MTTTIEPSVRTNVFESGEYRVEGREKVSGQAQYAADFTMPGMLWAAFTTSPTPHARIVSIDISAAQKMKGVHVVLTGKDLGERYFGRRLFDWPVLAIDRVRFIGDYVAAVAAETRDVAEAAAAAIEVEYEELPAIFDPEEALKPDALILHENPERLMWLAPPPKRFPVPHPNVQGYEKAEKGDVEAAFAQADRIFEETYTTPRHFPGYIEPRATLVWIDDQEIVHCISTNKSPFGLRDALSLSTGVPKEKIVVEPCFIGGDFGAKGLSVEEFHCYYLAAAAKRPVKYQRDYLDDIQSTNVRHASANHFKTAVKDGKITGFQMRVVFDGGAYAAGKVVPHLIPGLMIRTPYSVPNTRLERMTVYTNTVPGGFLRAPGDVQTLFGLESHLDVIARALGADPLEFRLRHAMREGDADFDGTIHHDAHGIEVLETLRREVDWSRKPQRGRGHGIAFAARHIGGGKTTIRLVLKEAGELDVITGCSEVGVGLLTVLQRVVAQALDVDQTRIHPRRDSTATAPLDPGVGGSRSTHIEGQAALNACAQLRGQLEGLGYPQKSFVDATSELLRSGPVVINGTYDDQHKHGDPEWSDVSAYYVDLSVDEATGTLDFHDILLVMDAGTIINPVAFRGQINGGFMFGVGHALTEDLRVEGGKIVNLNLGDYKLPTQMDAPPLRVAYVKAEHGPAPYGGKMVGELTTAAVAPAIANAIADATGVRIKDLPLSAERIFEALRESGNSKG